MHLLLIQSCNFIRVLFFITGIGALFGFVIAIGIIIRDQILYVFNHKKNPHQIINVFHSNIPKEGVAE